MVNLQAFVPRLFNQRSKLVLVLILFLGAYLRLWRIGEYMTFLGDEGRDVLVVKGIIGGLAALLRGDLEEASKGLTFLGPIASVGGFFLGPIYYYFMTPFLWAFRLDPTGPAVMVALFGLATIFLIYKTGREFFDPRAGLVASALYALSPLVIAYSRSSWNPNLVPFFALMLIYTLEKGTRGKKTLWWLFVAGLSLGIGLQLHYLFTFLFPVVGTFLMFEKTKTWFWKLKQSIVVALGSLTGFSPFLAFEMKHGFPNLQTIARFIFTGEETGFSWAEITPKLSKILFRLYARLVFHFPPPEQVEGQMRDLSSIFFWGKWAVVLTIIFSIGLLFFRTWWRKERQQRLLFLWLGFGLGLFAFYQRAVYDYYLGIMFPLPFLLIGGLFSFFFQENKKQKNYFFRGIFKKAETFKTWTLKSVALGGVLALLFLNWEGRPFKFAPNRQKDQAKEAAEFVLKKAQGQPFNFALITPQNSDHAYRYFMELAGNPPVVIENFEHDPERKTVTNQLLIICEVPAEDCQPLGHPLWEIAGFGRAETKEEWRLGVLTIVKLIHYEEKN